MPRKGVSQWKQIQHEQARPSTTVQKQGNYGARHVTPVITFSSGSFAAKENMCPPMNVITIIDSLQLICPMCWKVEITGVAMNSAECDGPK